MMKQDGPGAHKTGLKSCKQGHFHALSPQLRRNAAQRFHLRMAGQYKVTSIRVELSGVMSDTF